MSVSVSTVDIKVSLCRQTYMSVSASAVYTKVSLRADKHVNVHCTRQSQSLCRQTNMSVSAVHTKVSLCADKQTCQCQCLLYTPKSVSVQTNKHVNVSVHCTHQSQSLCRQTNMSVSAVHTKVSLCADKQTCQCQCPLYTPKSVSVQTNKHVSVKCTHQSQSLCRQTNMSVSVAPVHIKVSLCADKQTCQCPLYTEKSVSVQTNKQCHCKLYTPQSVSVQTNKHVSVHCTHQSQSQCRQTNMSVSVPHKSSLEWGGGGSRAEWLENKLKTGFHFICHQKEDTSFSIICLHVPWGG